MPIEHLDDYRVGWELIDSSCHRYGGNKCAAVAQFLCGCPYLCDYCGQRGFWKCWRRRDPARFARELAWLHREHGVEVINYFADELPTASHSDWQGLLDALIAEAVSLILVGSTRAGDIVRDADIPHLYRKAGIVRFLPGIESYDAATLAAIGKDAAPAEGREAIRLLYATSHCWARYASEVAQREIVQADTRFWDYRHQVLATPALPPWRMFLWAKAIETILQLRPKAIFRNFLVTDADFRHGMQWYVRIGRCVWFRELSEFLFFLGHAPVPRG